MVVVVKERGRVGEPVGDIWLHCQDRICQDRAIWMPTSQSRQGDLLFLSSELVQFPLLGELLRVPISSVKFWLPEVNHLR